MNKTFISRLLVSFALLAPALAVAQDSVSETVESFVVSSTPMAIAYIFSVTAMKVTAFVIGYLIVRLGHDTLVRGISGDIDFGFSGSGIDAKLKAASPGTFFVLAGAAIIVWGLFVEKPLDIKMAPATPVAQTVTSDAQDNSSNEVLNLVADPIE